MGMTDHINIADYIFDETEIPIKQWRKTKYQVRHKSRFMCVPEPWAIKVFQMAIKRQTPGPLIAGLLLWQRYHLEEGKQPFRLTNPMLSRFCIERRSMTRWLGMLEKAELISLQRFRHRSPLITIITHFFATKQKMLEEEREQERLDQEHEKLGSRCSACDGELDREECEAFQRSLRRDF